MKKEQQKAGKALLVKLDNRAKKMPVVDTSGRFKTKNKKHDTKVNKNLNIKYQEKSRLFVQYDTAATG